MYSFFTYKKKSRLRKPLVKRIEKQSNSDDRSKERAQGEHLRAEVESLRSMLYRWLGFSKAKSDKDDNETNLNKKDKKEDL